MNSIELTDTDGDALTIFTCDGATWITCTSGPDEVTVGPIPSHLVQSFVDSGLAA